MQKDNWIDEVFESTKGMQKAEPSPFLFEQITARINKGEYVSADSSPFLKWGLPTFVAIILAINVFSIVTSSETPSQDDTETRIAEAYFNNTTTYNY